MPFNPAQQIEKIYVVTDIRLLETHTSGVLIVAVGPITPVMYGKVQPLASPINFSSRERPDGLL